MSDTLYIFSLLLLIALLGVSVWNFVRSYRAMRAAERDYRDMRAQAEAAWARLNAKIDAKRKRD